MTGGWIVIGALSALTSVAMGAFGAHALRESLDARALEVYKTAAHYHMFHALGLIGIGILAKAAPQFSGATFQASGWLLVAGTVLFSGSLYALAITGIRVLGAITPLGGVAFMVGWALLAWVAYRTV